MTTKKNSRNDKRFTHLSFFHADTIHVEVPKKKCSDSEMNKSDLSTA